MEAVMFFLLVLKGGPNARAIRDLTAMLIQASVRILAEANAVGLLVNGRSDQVDAIVNAAKSSNHPVEVYLRGGEDSAARFVELCGAEAVYCSDDPQRIRELVERHPGIELFIETWLCMSSGPQRVPNEEAEELRLGIRRQKSEDDVVLAAHSTPAQSERLLKHPPREGGQLQERVPHGRNCRGPEKPQSSELLAEIG
jgi:hypothetical protein